MIVSLPDSKYRGIFLNNELKSWTQAQVHTAGLCLKSPRGHFSFTPGFSPVISAEQENGEPF